MFRNLSWMSILDPLREPALWVGAILTGVQALEAALGDGLGWGELIWVAVYAAGAILVRAVVTPLKNQSQPLTPNPVIET